MLSKSKYPNLSRVHRRHPERLMRASRDGGASPSNLLVALLIRMGYWPDNDVSNAAGIIEKIKRQVREEKAAREAAGPGIFRRAWGKVKSLFA